MCGIGPVWRCGSVKGPVVTTGSPVARSLLGVHMKGRGPGAGGGADDAQLEHVLKFLPSHLEAVRCEASGTCANWWTGGLNVVSNAVLDGYIR